MSALAGTTILASGCSLGSSADLAPVAERPHQSDPAPSGGRDHDAATRGDSSFQDRFHHQFADVDGINMHYVTGGDGPPLVLLHGWPQSWFAWFSIMPMLAEQFTVYAVDLPGLGDSKGAPPSYDKATLARFLHGLLTDRLGLDDIGLVGHDLGAGVGYQYTASHPDEVARYAHLDYPLPGPALSAAEYRTYSWHLAFHQQPGLPEQLVDDEVREYLAAFYPLVAHGGVGYGGPGAEQPFSKEQIDEFARTYQRPQVLTGGFELYRTLEKDEEDTIAREPVDVPTLLMSAEGGMAGMRPTIEPRLPNVERAVEVPRSGHWLPEENPDFVTSTLTSYFTGS